MRRRGLQLAERAGKNANKRAVIAVARKLAVLLHKLWINGEVYEPLPNNQESDECRGLDLELGVKMSSDTRRKANSPPYRFAIFSNRIPVGGKAGVTGRPDGRANRAAS